jgi:hypothetical protein
MKKFTHRKGKKGSPNVGPVGSKMGETETANALI